VEAFLEAWMAKKSTRIWHTIFKLMSSFSICIIHVYSYMYFVFYMLYFFVFVIFCISFSLNKLYLVVALNEAHSGGVGSGKTPVLLPLSKLIFFILLPLGHAHCFWWKAAQNCFYKRLFCA